VENREDVEKLGSMRDEMKRLKDTGIKVRRALERFILYISIVSVFGMAFKDGKIDGISPLDDRRK
jgi:hypothetical protein